MDALIATALMGVLLTASLATMTSMAQARHATENRAIAIEIAASAIERARGLAWDEITTERLDEIAHKSQIDGVLPRAELKLTVEPSGGEPPCKHIRAAITWTNATGGVIAPVRLDYWAYASEGGSP